MIFPLWWDQDEQITKQIHYANYVWVEECMIFLVLCVYKNGLEWNLGLFQKNWVRWWALCTCKAFEVGMSYLRYTLTIWGVGGNIFLPFSYCLTMENRGKIYLEIVQFLMHTCYNLMWYTLPYLLEQCVLEMEGLKDISS